MNFLCSCFNRASAADAPQPLELATPAVKLGRATTGKPALARASVHVSAHEAKVNELRQRELDLQDNLERDDEAGQKFRNYLIAQAQFQAGLDAPIPKPEGINHFLRLHEDIKRVRIEIRAAEARRFT